MFIKSLFDRGASLFGLIFFIPGFNYNQHFDSYQDARRSCHI